MKTVEGNEALPFGVELQFENKVANTTMINYVEENQTHLPLHTRVQNAMRNHCPRHLSLSQLQTASLFDSQFGTFAQQAHDGFAFVLSNEARFLYVSEMVSIYLGLSSVELTGSHVCDYIHADDQTEFLALFHGSSATQSPSSSCRLLPSSAKTFSPSLVTKPLPMASTTTSSTATASNNNFYPNSAYFNAHYGQQSEGVIPIGYDYTNISHYKKQQTTVDVDAFPADVTGVKEAEQQNVQTRLTSESQPTQDQLKSRVALSTTISLSAIKTNEQKAHELTFEYYFSTKSNQPFWHYGGAHAKPTLFDIYRYKSRHANALQQAHYALPQRLQEAREACCPPEFACIRFKSTLTKRGVQMKYSGYRVSSSRT